MQLRANILDQLKELSPALLQIGKNVVVGLAHI
jgi:hypothetical protein